MSQRWLEVGGGRPCAPGAVLARSGAAGAMGRAVAQPLPCFLLFFLTESDLVLDPDVHTS